MRYNEYVPYEIGSTARKREVYTDVSKRTNVKQDKKVKKISKKAVKTQNRAAIYLFIACVFSMTILLTHRYNVISEKNLKVQELKEELEDAESLLATTKIDVESNTDYNAIEAYAKQKLGMQKPSVNQIVYVDSSLQNDLVENVNNSSAFSNFISNIKAKLSSIF